MPIDLSTIICCPPENHPCGVQSVAGRWGQHSTALAGRQKSNSTFTGIFVRSSSAASRNLVYVFKVFGGFVLMKSIFLVALAVLSSGLASCAPSREAYEARVTALEGSSRLRTEAYQRCVKQERSPEWIKRASMTMDVPENKVRTLYCQRIVNAEATGKIGYNDLAINNGGRMNPNVIKVVQGRR